MILSYFDYSLCMVKTKSENVVKMIFADGVEVYEFTYFKGRRQDG